MRTGKRMHPWLTVLIFAGVLTNRAGAVEITPQADKSLLVTARTYRALVDRTGLFRSLRIQGVEFLEGATIRKTIGSAPVREGGADASSVAAPAVQGHAITARLDGARLRWTFDETGIDVTTEGGALEFRLAKAVSAFVVRNGQAVDRSRSVGDVAKVVAGSVALALNQSFHHNYGRLWPSLLARGGKAEAPFKYRIECGVAVAPVELIALASPTVGTLPAHVTPIVPAGDKAQVKVPLKNLGLAEAAAARLRVEVVNHPMQVRSFFDRVVLVTLSGGQATTCSVTVPLPAPGLYWVRAAVVDHGQAMQQTQLGFLHDPEHYRPPLTRPEDFRAFWDGKLQAMRALPFDARLTPVPAKGNARFVHYDLAITVAGGKRVQTFLRLPRAPGKHDAEVYSHWGSDTAEQIRAGLDKLEKQEAGAGMWQRGTDRIRVGAPQPEDSTYTRWAGRDDNNLLDSYLLNVRMADYLRARPDVDRLWMFGASRSGASMFAATALCCERVVAVNVHVSTSCGLSWTDRPYQGWGRPPATTPAGLRVAAYFDPVNFAPDLTVPLLVDGGMYDTLSPAPGILALHNWATQAPFRRWAIEQGGHGMFPPNNRRRMESELAEYVKTHAAGDTK